MHFENLIQESGHTNLIALPAVLSVRRAAGSTRPSLALQNVRPPKKTHGQAAAGFSQVALAAAISAADGSFRSSFTSQQVNQ